MFSIYWQPNEPLQPWEYHDFILTLKFDSFFTPVQLYSLYWSVLAVYFFHVCVLSLVGTLPSLQKISWYFSGLQVHFLSSLGFSSSANPILKRSQAKIENRGFVELGISCFSFFVCFYDRLCLWDQPCFMELTLSISFLHLLYAHPWPHKLRVPRIASRRCEGFKSQNLWVQTLLLVNLLRDCEMLLL